MTVWASKFNSPVASIALTNTPICHSNPSQKRWNWVNWIGKTLKTIDMDIFSILTVFFSRIALHNMRHYLPVITESITNYHQPWNLVLKKRQFRRCSASSPWLEGGSPRLSAKVSANGPISRGGNDRSCKESKVLGRLKMLVTSVEKKPDMQKHMAQRHAIDFLKKNDCTLWWCKILCWKIPENPQFVF